jgi:hypothetical protein
MARRGIAPETITEGFKSTQPHPTPAKVRSVENKSANSVTYKGNFAGRASIHGPRYVIDIEVVDARKWTPTVSADGVHSFQTTLRQSALERGSKA